jgi:hypothetical protein
VVELRSRHWIGDCGDLSIGVKMTEVVPGQFDGIPFETYVSNCGFTSSGHTHHDMHPVSPEAYQAWCDEDDDVDVPLPRDLPS